MPIATSSKADERSLPSTSKDDNATPVENNQSPSPPSLRHSADLSNKRFIPSYETHEADLESARLPTLQFPPSSYISPTTTQSQASRFSPFTDPWDGTRRRVFSTDGEAERLRQSPSHRSVAGRSESPARKRQRISFLDEVEWNADIDLPSNSPSDDTPTQNGATNTPLSTSEAGASHSQEESFSAMDRRRENDSELDPKSLDNGNVSDVMESDTSSVFSNIPIDTERLLIDLTNVEDSDYAEEDSLFSFRSPPPSLDSFGDVRVRNDTPIPERGLTIPCPLPPYSPPGRLHDDLFDDIFPYPVETRDPLPFGYSVADAIRGLVVPQRSELDQNRNLRIAPEQSTSGSSDGADSLLHRRMRRHQQSSSGAAGDTEPLAQPIFEPRGLQFPTAWPVTPLHMPPSSCPLHSNNRSHTSPGLLSLAAHPPPVSPVLTAQNRPSGSTHQPLSTYFSSSHQRHHFPLSPPPLRLSPVIPIVPSLQPAHATRPRNRTVHDYSQRLPSMSIPSSSSGVIYRPPTVYPGQLSAPSDADQPSHQFRASQPSGNLRRLLNNDLNQGTARQPGLSPPQTFIRQAAFPTSSHPPPRRMAAESNTTLVSSFRYTQPRRMPLSDQWEYWPSASHVRSNASRRNSPISNTSRTAPPLTPATHSMTSSFPLFPTMHPPVRDFHARAAMPRAQPTVASRLSNITFSSIHDHAQPMTQGYGLSLGNARLHEFFHLRPYVSLEDESDRHPFNFFFSLTEELGSTVKPRGLSKSRIEQLYSYRYKPGTRRINQPTCVVCMCEWESKQLVRVLPCSHEFHAKCVDKWLKKNSTCPICRGDAGQCEAPAPPGGVNHVS